MKQVNEYKYSGIHRWMVLCISLALLSVTCKKQNDHPWPPEVQEVTKESPVRSPQEALKTFYLPPGYDLEIVAAEPLVEDPVAMDFDAEGRLWVVEMRSYMPNVEGQGEGEPKGRIVVLEDTTADGRMDKRTVYMDDLVLPRTVKVLDQGVLVGAPPHLWMTRDTTGNLKADVKSTVREDFGNPAGNPELNPNGLMWGMDNWIHATDYKGQFKLEGNKLRYRKVPVLGQWGISMDNYGRIYRNSNENPLAIDYLPSHYYANNENYDRSRGIYESIYKDKLVWPVHPTPGVNRGYREHVLREDSTLKEYTAASALAVYRGDRLPDELRNNVFVPEPAGNLVQRYVIEKKADGSLIGYNPYEDQQADFLSSTDERFRPVNVYSAPDGTLYIVDMYRGIIQNKAFLTQYLKREIQKRGLEMPIGLGRIYRIVHSSKEPGKKPELSSKSADELVSYLGHPNGWWRDTAQRLLVERQATSVVSTLQHLAGHSPKDYTRLQALWTLDGLNKIDNKTLKSALSDSSPYLRAAAIRIAESTFGQSDYSLKSEVMTAIDDSSTMVQRQLAASISKFPVVDRAAALVSVITRYGDDPVVVDLAINGLAHQGFSFLEKLLVESRGQAATNYKKMLTGLASVILRSDSTDHRSTLLHWIGDEDRPTWQRSSLLAALEDVAPKHGLFKLNHKPAGLLAATKPDSQLAKKIDAVVQRLSWPGKPTAKPPTKPLTSGERKRIQQGEKIFVNYCASCHQEDGRGMKGLAPSLVDSKWVLEENSRDVIRILIDGKEDEMLMPPVGDKYSDEEIAAIASYIRQAWGHQESLVTPSEARDVRGASTGRKSPWTEEELMRQEH